MFGFRKKKYIYASQQSYVASKIKAAGIKKKLAYNFDDGFYSSLVHKYDGESFGNMLKSVSTTGNCYFYALLLSRAMPNAALKIGYLNTLNASIRDEYFEKYGHAWVELGSKVYDTTLKTVFDKEFYYQQFDAEVEKSFEHDELCDDVNFFALGLFAVRYRPELFEKYKKYTLVIYNQNKTKCDEIIKNFDYKSYDIKQEDIEKLFS